MVTNFEIFRMREKQVPVDVVEMKGESLVILPNITVVLIANVGLFIYCIKKIINVYLNAFGKLL